MPRRALVLGSTGLVGAFAVRALMESDVYERVTCLVRRPGQRGRESSSKLHERVVDFSALSLADVDPCDDLFCAVGTTMKRAGSKEAFRAVDLDLPLRAAELAVRRDGQDADRRVKRIALVSSAGADASSKNFYLRTKGELEAALGQLPLEALYIFRPSLLLGDRSESRPGEAAASLFARAARPLLVGGLRKWRAIDAERVGRAMVAAMVSPDPPGQRQILEHDAIVSLR